MQCGQCGNESEGSPRFCPACGAEVEYPSPPWVYPGTDARSDYHLPPAPQMRLAVPEIEPEIYEWAKSFASVNGGYQPAIMRLRRELYIYLVPLALCAISLAVTLPLSGDKAEGTAFNVSMAVALFFGVLLVVGMMRLGKIVGISNTAWVLVALGCIPFVSLFVGLYLLVILLQRIRLLTQVEARDSRM